MKKTETAIQRCKTMSTLQKILGGKWKLEILYYIAFRDIHRFGELRRQLGEITESSLTKQLRELEADGFLIRHDFKEIPPRVEYTLSDLGSSFIDVIDYMKNWGDHNLPTWLRRFLRKSIARVIDCLFRYNLSRFEYLPIKAID